MRKLNPNRKDFKTVLLKWTLHAIIIALTSKPNDWSLKEHPENRNDLARIFSFMYRSNFNFVIKPRKHIRSKNVVNPRELHKECKRKLNAGAITRSERSRGLLRSTKDIHRDADGIFDNSRTELFQCSETALCLVSGTERSNYVFLWYLEALV